MTRDVAIGAALCGTLVFFAFVAAPSSCDWGLAAYFWDGVICAATLAALPMVPRSGVSWAKRALFAIAFAAAGIAVWTAGLFAANMRIVCRLF